MLKELIIINRALNQPLIIISVANYDLDKNFKIGAGIVYCSCREEDYQSH